MKTSEELMVFHACSPRRGIVPRLQLPELSALCEALPLPDEVWCVSGVRFELYRAKHLGNPRWPNVTLLALLIDARGSYYMYGDRPPLDQYDAKAAVYIVRAIYDAPFYADGAATMEEWLSVRLVPPEGEPYGAGELDRFLCLGKPIAYWAMARLGGGNPDVLNAIPACSRMCGLGPFIVEGHGARFAANARHRFNAHCYALIRDLILRDIADAGRDYRFLSGIIHDTLAQKSLTLTVNGERCGIGYTPAHELLGFPGSRDVFLDRTKRDLLPYRFPTYWFNAPELLALVEKLRNARLLPDETLARYLGISHVPETLTVKELRLLGKLLAVRGPAAHAPLTGKELRLLVDRDVRDGPELKITPMQRVNADIEWIRKIRTHC